VLGLTYVLLHVRIRRKCVKQFLCGDLKPNYQRQNFKLLIEKGYKLYFDCKLGLNNIRVFVIDMYYVFKSSNRLASWVSSNAVCCSDDMESAKKLFNKLSPLRNILRVAERYKQYARQKCTLSHKVYFESEDLPVPKPLET
jgi:hypothetical protein